MTPLEIFGSLMVLMALLGVLAHYTMEDEP